jgi:hypothetical protein
MADDYINMHKRLAMGQSGAETHLKKGGKVAKYAKGGAVMSESKVANLPARSSAPPPLPKPTGKIATLKKGGAVPKRGMGITIAVAVPARKAAGRGR